MFSLFFSTACMAPDNSRTGSSCLVLWWWRPSDVRFRIVVVMFNLLSCSLPTANYLASTRHHHGEQEQKKAAELEKQNNMSSMRVSGPRPLDPDEYDRFECAVCMKIAAPVLLGPAAAGAYAGGAPEAGGAAAAGKEASGGEEAGGKEAGGGPAAAPAPDPDLAECAKCGVRVHRECYGVPEGLGAPGAVGERREACRT